MLIYSCYWHVHDYVIRSHFIIFPEKGAGFAGLGLLLILP